MLNYLSTILNKNKGVGFFCEFIKSFLAYTCKKNNPDRFIAKDYQGWSVVNY